MIDNNAQRDNLSFLHGQFTISVRDPLWKDIKMNQGFITLLHLPIVQKLGRIKQLGPTFHIYPGAVHTRLDHSLGVYHVAKLMLSSLLTNQQAEPLISRTGMLSFLAAALLHDIGHFPYAHSLKELPLTEHEQLASLMIEQDLDLKNTLLDIGCDILKVRSIIDDTIPCNDAETQFYRSLLSGTLDPDKLDYLSRDAFFCGVPYGIQDVSYIIDRIVIHQGQPAISRQAIGSVEHLLFSKYLMYQNVYWHKGTRVATAMIKKALLAALESNVITPDDLYDMDDMQFSMLPRRYNFKPFELISQVQDNQLLSCPYECNFDETKIFHERVRSLETRTRCELKIHEALVQTHPQLPYWQVIIDVPEPISFEADIPICTSDEEAIPFYACDELFTTDVVKTFSKTLRKLRIFTPSYVNKEVLNDILANGVIL